MRRFPHPICRSGARRWMMFTGRTPVKIPQRGETPMRASRIRYSKTHSMRSHSLSYRSCSLGMEVSRTVFLRQAVRRRAEAFPLPPSAGAYGHNRAVFRCFRRVINVRKAHKREKQLAHALNLIFKILSAKINRHIKTPDTDLTASPVREPIPAHARAVSGCSPLSL